MDRLKVCCAQRCSIAGISFVSNMNGHTESVVLRGALPPVSVL
jgi:hypothetical protein